MGTARKAMDTVRTEHQRPCSAGLPSGSCSKCGIAVHVGEEGDGGVDADDFPASHCINGFRERNTAEQDSVRMQCCNCQMWDDNGQWSSAELQHRRRARLVTEHKPYVTRACEHCRTRRACWGGARTLHAFQDRVQKEHSEATMAFALALHPRLGEQAPARALEIEPGLVERISQVLCEQQQLQQVLSASATVGIHVAPC